jgi:hypothetical protein
LKLPHDTANAGSERTSRFTLLAAGVWLGFIPLLIYLPRLRASDPSVLSASSVDGYETGLAYIVAVLWAAVSIGVSYLATRGRVSRAGIPTPSLPEAPLSRRRRWLERVFLAVVVAIAYWPWWLARYGPFVEDNIFVTALHRMHGGMQPYRDFEFLYGPLMLIPASWWMNLVGYSLKSYYVYLALLEITKFVVALAIVQHFVPKGRHRLVIFVAIAAILANPLLGVNYVGIRWLLPSAALALIARDPRSLRHAVGGGVLLGLSTAYSHDYGILFTAAAVATYAVLWVRRPNVALIARAFTVGAVAVAVWLLTAFLLLRDIFPAYIEATRSLVARFSAGEAGFPFYWTANSLAAFGLLAIALVALGRSFATRDEPTTWGDNFFIAVTLASLLVLKSALNRSDLWHLDAAFYPLVVAWLLPLPRHLMIWTARQQSVIRILIAIFISTGLLGVLPTVSHVGQGWLRGAKDALSGVPTSKLCPPDTAAPCIESERSHARPDVIEVARYLADPSRRSRRTLFYGRLWAMSSRVGVYKQDALNDAFIYDDRRGEAVARWLLEKPDAIVVIATPWYERLVAPPGQDSLGRESPMQPSAVKTMAQWLSSDHFRGMLIEWPLGELRWRRTVGVAVRSDFVKAQTFGDLTVLTRRTAVVAGAP